MLIYVLVAAKCMVFISALGAAKCMMLMSVLVAAKCKGVDVGPCSWKRHNVDIGDAKYTDRGGKGHVTEHNDIAARSPYVFICWAFLLTYRLIRLWVLFPDLTSGSVCATISGFPHRGRCISRHVGLLSVPVTVNPLVCWYRLQTRDKEHETKKERKKQRNKQMLQKQKKTNKATMCKLRINEN